MLSKEPGRFVDSEELHTSLKQLNYGSFLRQLMMRR